MNTNAKLIEIEKLRNRYTQGCSFKKIKCSRGISKIRNRDLEVSGE
jgi:hypothetical protein